MQWDLGQGGAHGARPGEAMVEHVLNRMEEMLPTLVLEEVHKLQQQSLPCFLLC